MNNLEKGQLIEKDYEIYEDEIDLKELFLVLWRNKIKIIVIAVICMILGFISGKVMANKNKRASVVVEYNYPGIEAGLTPTGERFSPTYRQFKNIFMIKTIYDELPELNNENFSQDDLLSAIKISPVLPKDLKDGEVYYPNSFTYNLKISKSDEENENILKYFIDIQRNYFKENYKLGIKIPYLNFDKNIPYDYYDMVSIIDSSLGSAINSINKIDPKYMSARNSIEMQSLLKELEILRTVNIEKIKNLINDYNITKNPEELMVTYRQKLEDLNIAKEKSLGKITQLENMVKTYKPNEKSIVIMSNGSSEKVNTEEENYYTEFLRELAAEKIRLSDINIQIKYLKDKMNKSLNKDITKTEEVNKDIEFIVIKVNEKIKRINELNIENYNKKYADIIKIRENITTTSDSKTLILTLAGLILGGFLGICYVLLMNFINEEKNKR